MSVLQRARNKAEFTAHKVLSSVSFQSPITRSEGPGQPWWEAPETDEDFVKDAYLHVFGRVADPGGLQVFVGKIKEGWSRRDVISALEVSEEAKAGPTPRLAADSFHGGRITWIRSLPPARRILDLGGTALGDDRGAMVVMGYPYNFDDLVIVELPPDERHELYRLAENKAVQTDGGPVRYLYRAMSDLGDLADGSFDMVCSAQTFEHITPDQGKQMLADARRLLAPGGVLALDTPNVAVSGIESRDRGTEFINPDHKIEYTHSQMVALFDEADLKVIRQHGIGYMPRTVSEDRFIIDELIQYPGLYDDIEKCYTLAYLVQPR